MPNRLQFITWRLADSLPSHVLDQLESELTELPKEERIARAGSLSNRHLDRGYGACWLRNPGIASIVECALLNFDGTRYRMLEWVVMPNHVHLVAEIWDGFPLPDVVKGWKGVSARRANAVLVRTGDFWYPDYYDRYIRDHDHYQNVVQYIAQNPVRAGLCRQPEAWKFSSIGRRASVTRSRKGS